MRKDRESGVKVFSVCVYFLSIFVFKSIKKFLSTDNENNSSRSESVNELLCFCVWTFAQNYKTEVIRSLCV